MEPDVRPEPEPLGHRLDALALTRADQADDVERTHALPRLVPEFGEKECQPPFQFGLPLRAKRLSRHDRFPKPDPS